MGTVTIRGEGFSAEVRAEDGTPLIGLSGTLKDGVIHAEATRQETDDAPRRLTGTRKISRLRNIGTARDAILLFEPGLPGGLTIGITKAVADRE
jgi:hypothetical protein